MLHRAGAEGDEGSAGSSKVEAPGKEDPMGSTDETQPDDAGSILTALTVSPYNCPLHVPLPVRRRA